MQLLRVRRELQGSLVVDLGLLEASESSVGRDQVDAGLHIGAVQPEGLLEGLRCLSRGTPALELQALFKQRVLVGPDSQDCCCQRIVERRLRRRPFPDHFQLAGRVEISPEPVVEGRQSVPDGPCLGSQVEGPHVGPQCCPRFPVGVLGAGKPEVRRRTGGVRLDQTLEDAAAFAWPAVPQQSVSKVNPCRDRTWFQSGGSAKANCGVAIAAKLGVNGSKVVRPSPVPGFQRLGAAIACDGLLVEPVCLQDRPECPLASG